MLHLQRGTGEALPEEFTVIIQDHTGDFNFLNSKAYSLYFSYGKIGIKVGLTVTFAFCAMSQICVIYHLVLIR